ncbi:MAG: sodium:calcium antiporter, partial [Beijerinckiaceae bacterium]|nr:sodium:calcium antiporter [Beijerinckiaceae bacterium]
ASALFLALMFVGQINRLTGLAMLALLIAFITIAYRVDRRTGRRGLDDPVPEPFSRQPLLQGIALALGGLAGLALGAYLLVDGASSLARTMGISEAVIGLTIVAIGTSLPELAASIMAAVRRHPEVVLANVIGSNLFNILANMGATATIQPLSISSRFLTIDGPAMLAAALFVTLIIFTTGRIGRLGGAAMVMVFALYMAAQAR